MEDNKIVLINDDGKEIEMNIYFTFDANDKNYVVVYESTNEDDLYCFTYDDKGNLYEVEDENELNMASEIIDAFEEDNNLDKEA